MMASTVPQLGYSYRPPLGGVQQQFQSVYPENSIVFPGQPTVLPPCPRPNYQNYSPSQVHSPSQNCPTQYYPPFQFDARGRGRGQFRPGHVHWNQPRGGKVGQGMGCRRGVEHHGAETQSGGGHFECKPCDRVYKTEENYKLHIATHEKCPSCDFAASGRAAREHQMIHRLPDFLKVNSKLEIERWREDRRKNYPTPENIARKEKLKEDKKARGETARTLLYRYVHELTGEYFDGGSYVSRRRRGLGRGRRRRGWQNHRGKHDHLMWRHTWQCGSEDRETARSSNVKEEHTTEKQLSSCKLDDQSVADAGEDNCSKNVDLSDNGKLNKKESKSCKDLVVGAILADVTVSRGGTSDENEKKLKEIDEALRSERGGKKRPDKEWKGRRKAKRLKKDQVVCLQDVQKRKPTLLEKLLAAEVRHEQNVMLQCIRHVVSTGFLSVSTRSKPDEKMETES